MRYFIALHNQQKIFLLVVACLLVGLSLLFILPITFSSAHATGTSSDSEVSLNVDSVINISSPVSATFDCTPGTATTPADLCTTVATVGVGTNNANGYTLQMNATSGYPTALTNSSIYPNATLPTINQAYTAANFPVNYWGYTGGTDQSSAGGRDCVTNYCPILAYHSSGLYQPNHTIKVTDAPATTSNTNITFGVKIDITKPFGTYSTSVTFTAVANIAPRPVSIMQDFDSAACDTIMIDQTFTLRDSRDNTEYTAARLRDGNCWMTQNLELGEYGTPMNLTSDTSNVSSSGYTLDLQYANASVYKGNSNHYGNYYTYPQATAGSGTTTLNQDAPYDICPKGWRLPSVSSTYYANQEVYKMMVNYIDDDVEWHEDLPYDWLPYWAMENDLRPSPISLVWAGEMYPNGDIASFLVGAAGYWWTATASNSSNNEDWAYMFGFDCIDGGEAWPKYRDTQSYGLSVRCMVPGT